MLSPWLRLSSSECRAVPGQVVCTVDLGQVLAGVRLPGGPVWHICPCLQVVGHRTTTLQTWFFHVVGHSAMGSRWTSVLPLPLGVARTPSIPFLKYGICF